MFQILRQIVAPFFRNSVKMDFAEVRQGVEKKTILLIDVRNVDEIKKDGKIPGSHNIPLSQLKSALSLPDSDFSERFGFQKPSADADDVPIVVTCLRGGRAEMANTAFQGLGYSNTRVYRGSFLDWVAKGGPVEKI